MSFSHMIMGLFDTQTPWKTLTHHKSIGNRRCGRKHVIPVWPYLWNIVGAFKMFSCRQRGRWNRRQSTSSTCQASLRACTASSRCPGITIPPPMTTGQLWFKKRHLGHVDCQSKSKFWMFLWSGNAKGKDETENESAQVRRIVRSTWRHRHWGRLLWSIYLIWCWYSLWFGLIFLLIQILPAEYGGSNGTIADLTTYWKVAPFHRVTSMFLSLQHLVYHSYQYPLYCMVNC